MIVPAPISLPMLQKTELIEFWSAYAKVTVPNTEGPVSGLPALRTRLPYSSQYPGSTNWDSGVNRPLSRAAAAVSTLKVEPGT
jgi:hypothetical protein